MRKEPKPYLQHIVEACDKIDQFLQGYSKQTFLRDDKTQFAVIKLLEIVGEACHKLEVTFKQSHPDIPWKSINGMRNRLAHEYWDINLNIVWTTATKHAPQLKSQIKSLLL